jgi:hypothetical protein
MIAFLGGLCLGAVAGAVAVLVACACVIAAGDEP